jgi:hypothetical protein
MAKKKEEEGKKIVIPAFNFPLMHVTVIGITSLICNRFTKKMLGGLPDAGIDTDEEAPVKGKKGASKPERDFEADFRGSLYPLQGGGYGFPAMAFKRAIVGACRQVGSLDMTLANRIVFVHATEDVLIEGFTTPCVRIDGKPTMRKDVGRNSGATRSPRICCRGEFMPWKAKLVIEYNANMLKPADVLQLVQYGGKCEGVGEQRPSAKFASGNNGQFRIDAGK